MLFCAELTDFKIIHNVLRSITMTDFAVVRPLEEGLEITLDEMKCAEISAYIPCHLFTTYHVDSNEDIVFKVCLKTLVDILNIFGDNGNPNLKLTYKSVGSPLCLVMNHNEENVTVDCEIRTMNVDDDSGLNLGLADEYNLNKMVINASIFTELLHRLDNYADEITFNFSPDPPYFTLSTSGISGESEVSISKNSESVTKYQCKEPVTCRYCFGNIRQILKVMNYADKVAISTGESGLLGLQLAIVSDDRQMFVKYYVTSLYNDKD